MEIKADKIIDRLAIRIAELEKDKAFLQAQLEAYVEQEEEVAKE